MRPLALGKQKSIKRLKNHPIDEESVIVEQYRTISNNIRFIIEDQKNNAILITSPGKGEGKSAAAANVAVSIAQQGEDVLIIDANIRNPALHKIFDIPNHIGLTDVLAEKATIEDVVSSSNISGLHILPSGKLTINLSPQRILQLLNQVKTMYNIVIIDSPPLLEANDAQILANICDGVVLVVKQDGTRIESAMECKKILEYAHATIVGAILNEKR